MAFLMFNILGGFKRFWKMDDSSKQNNFPLVKRLLNIQRNQI